MQNLASIDAHMQAQSRTHTHIYVYVLCSKHNDYKHWLYISEKQDEKRNATA